MSTVMNLRVPLKVLDSFLAKNKLLIVVSFLAR
jgi:hypothetical protein